MLAGEESHGHGLGAGELIGCAALLGDRGGLDEFDLVAFGCVNEGESTRTIWFHVRAV